MTTELFKYLIPIGLGAVALITALCAWWRTGQLARELRADFALESRRPFDRFMQAYVVRREGERIVLSRTLREVRNDYVEQTLAHATPFWFGGLLTGVALIFTFLLIASVMTGEVPSAISEDANASALSAAVDKLGGKFLISASGIAGSVVCLLICNLLRAWLHRRANEVSLELQARFVSLEATELDARLQQVELLRAEREDRAAQHRALVQHLASLDERAHKLTSIEVSVQTIGNEVSANLKNIMKDAMGEELRAMLVDTMVEVARIADRVQEHMTGQLQASLAAVQRAVENQAQGQLESILEKLQTAVSGGFHNESSKMAVALDAFSRVVPALEQQLRKMTDEVAEDSRRRSAESAQASQAVLAQVSGLVDAMSSQHAASVQAIDRIEAASARGAEDMARRMSAAAETSAARHVELEHRAASAAETVALASDGIAQAARTLAELTAQTTALLQQARAGNADLQASTRELAAAGNGFATALSAMQQVAALTRTQTAEQQALLLRQREYTKEVERLWPQLFETYLAKFQTTAGHLGQAWQDLYDRIVQVSTQVGAQFADNTEELSAAVERLVRHFNPRVHA